jgi:peptide chain release factor subunit 1
MELQPLIDRLAEFPPGDQPFVSVYLDARPDQTGRGTYQTFVRSELKARAATYPEHSEARQSLDADVEHIVAWLDGEARPQANGIAIFACAGANVFEAVQVEAPFEQSAVVVGPRPHLYPLAAVADRYRRHAAVVLDTHSARIFVFGLGEVQAERAIESDGLPRTDAGGWSQARYQRHVEEFQRQHAREVAEALERLVREEGVDRTDPSGLRGRGGRRGAEVADELVAKARQTDARVTFIEDPRWLADAGGVGGLLRFRLRGAA